MKKIQTGLSQTEMNLSQNIGEFRAIINVLKNNSQTKKSKDFLVSELEKVTDKVRKNLDSIIISKHLDEYKKEKSRSVPS